MERLLNRQQVLEVKGAIDTYMQTRNDTNFDRIFNKIRDYNLDPTHFMLRASSETTARVVEALLDSVRKRAALEAERRRIDIEAAALEAERRGNDIEAAALEAERRGIDIEAAALEAEKIAANYTSGNGETPLVEALKNPNTQEMEEIVKLLLEYGADPNNDRRERENFFYAIYEDEMNSHDLPERMASLQRIRDLLHDKKFQFNAPFNFRRFRRQAAAPQAAAPQAEQVQAAAPQPNDNMIGGKKKKKKRTQKKKKRTQKKKKKSMKKRNTKTHHKK